MTDGSNTKPAIDPSWYNKIVRSHPDMVRIDFSTAPLCNKAMLARGLAEYFKTQRLHPQEIEEWDRALLSGQPLSDIFIQKIRLSFAEGVLKDDLQTVDEDALTGTCGQLIFRWIRNQFFGDEIIYASPKILTDSSTEHGIDYFEILGNPLDQASLYFVVWEIKATDRDVTTRTNEIYQMHKKRSPRLLRGLELQLSLEYPKDEYPVLGTFVQQLLDHWLQDTPAKRIGGAVVFDAGNHPGEVFTTFRRQFPNLHSSACRQAILVEIPDFPQTRRELWTYLQAQISCPQTQIF